MLLVQHVEPAEGHYLQADLCLDESRQTELVQGPAAGPLSRLTGLNWFLISVQMDALKQVKIGSKAGFTGMFKVKGSTWSVVDVV